MVPRFLSAIFVTLSVLALQACRPGEPEPMTAATLAAGLPPVPAWDSALARDHPLTGKIWLPAQGRFATPEEVLPALLEARFVLLGEKHDNADHHRIQAWLLAALVDGGRRPTVAFEMLDRDQEPVLADYLAAHPGDAAGLGPAVGWAETGWPDWSLYQPIAKAALDGGLPLVAASLPRRALRDVSRQGPEALGRGREAALGLDRALPSDQEAALRREIVESHCNLLPDSMTGPMVMVTRVKDAVMAESMIRGASRPGTEGAVLIAGSGHVRADRGVPWYLADLAPGAGAATLGLVEVAAGTSDPALYAARFGAETLPFDFVWFTPPVDTLDPCDAYAGQLERARDRHNEKQEE